MGYKHGDVINGYEYLPANKRKKILLLSDDLRMSSGVGTVSREIVIQTSHHFNWVQIGAAIKHPEANKRIDISQAINEEVGLTDASVIIYPFDGYGNVDFIRWMIKTEKIDALMPYTDPRFWNWLFNHEHELRQKMPIVFYHVWDDLPYPHYNEHFYESCTWIPCISKQTYNIVKNVWKTYPPEDWQVSYIPHGIPEKVFYPLTPENPGKIRQEPSGKTIKDSEGKEVNEIVDMLDYEIMQRVHKQMFGNRETKFVVLYVNRNVRRKMTGDVILAYNAFCDSLPPEDAKTCVLLMHTAVSDEAGTNLQAVIDDLNIKHRIVFSDQRIEPRYMNYVYNIADVTINLASNEGFGLGTAESLLAGTPIIVNVTGGLQDQCGFVDENGEYLKVDKHYRTEWGSNHDGRYKKHGDWCKIIFPSTLSLQGSIPTPYIFDDRCRWQDVAPLLKEWYDVGREERKRRGLLGREYMFRPEIGMTATEMGRRFIEGINNTFQNFKPRKRFTLYEA